MDLNPLVEAQDAKDFCERIYINGGSVDRIILILRLLGFSQSLSTVIVEKACHLDHGAAKEAVISSPVWSDMFEANEALQKMIEKFLDLQGN